jgi:hypothetical protein
LCSMLKVTRPEQRFDQFAFLPSFNVETSIVQHPSLFAVDLLVLVPGLASVKTTFANGATPSSFRRNISLCSICIEARAVCRAMLMVSKFTVGFALLQMRLKVGFELVPSLTSVRAHGTLPDRVVVAFFLPVRAKLVFVFVFCLAHDTDMQCIVCDVQMRA